MFLNRFSIDPAVAEYDAAIPSYMQPLCMTPQQYADGSTIKSYKVAKLYD